MDDVLFDWSGAVLKLFNSNVRIEECKNWNFTENLGISNHELWTKIESTPGFWENLELLPWARELYKSLCLRYEVYICSAPSRDPECWSGKIISLREKLKVLSSRAILVNDKFLLAKPGTFLLDDRISNVTKFQDHGGTGILFERPWNVNNVEKNKVHYIYNLKTQDIESNK